MNKLLPLVLLGILGQALAHTEVTSVTPGPKTAVTAPRTVVLRFSEPVDLRFSTFRVMALPPGKTPEEAARVALALGVGSPELLNQPVTDRHQAARLSLALKPGLKSGRYVVAWKLLSGDGHPVTGQSVFQVR